MRMILSVCICERYWSALMTFGRLEIVQETWEMSRLVAG